MSLIEWLAAILFVVATVAFFAWVTWLVISK
jgi:hypothetical protein